MIVVILPATMCIDNRLLLPITQPVCLRIASKKKKKIDAHQRSAHLLLVGVEFSKVN